MSRDPKAEQESTPPRWREKYARWRTEHKQRPSGQKELGVREDLPVRGSVAESEVVREMQGGGAGEASRGQVMQSL